MGSQLPLAKRGAEPANFRPMSVVAKRIKMPLGTKVGLVPGHIVLDGAQLPPPKKKGGGTAPNFRPMSIVAKRSPISAKSAEDLFMYM